jgi:molecular chaperone DnaJ
MAEKRDYYEILGVSKNATKDEIKRAYRNLARKYHPDINRDDAQAEEKFKEINEANEVLCDDHKRSMYDQYGFQGVNGHMHEPGFDGFGGFGDIFDMFFGGAHGRSQRRTGEDGADIRYDIEITLEEVAKGVEKTIQISRLLICDTCGGSGSEPGKPIETCQHCKGTGQVVHNQQTILGSFQSVTLCPVCRGEGKIIRNPCNECNGHGRKRGTVERTVSIPPGIDNASKIRIRGEGDSGIKGGAPGDLYVVVFVKAHEIFERRGSDLICKIPISFVQAALGDTIEVPLIDGKESLQIPEGTQTGKSFKLKGKGLPHLNSSSMGDEYVIVNVVTPKNLNEEQKKILRDFAKAGGDELPNEEGKSLFERLLGK